MIRREFIDIVTATGMATLKELRRLSMGRDDEINEFELLSMPYFDENKFAKICSERYAITFIDLRNAKVPADTLMALKKRYVIKWRAIPIQKTATKVTVATFDPSVVTDGGRELQDIFKKQVEFILTNISSGRSPPARTTRPPPAERERGSHEPGARDGATERGRSAARGSPSSRAAPPPPSSRCG